MVRRSTETRQHPMQCPGEVVSAMILHCHPGVQEMEEGLAEGVAAHQHRTEKRKSLKRQKFTNTRVLSGQSKRVPVHMVSAVDVVVKPGNSRGEKI